MMETTDPEVKRSSEAVEVRSRIADTEGGRRPADETYPYFAPEYDLRCLHIGTEKQLFVDNFILDHLDGVQRVICKPERPEEPILDAQDHPWEEENRIFPAAALHDPDDGKFKIWYVQSTAGDIFGDQGMILCYAESSNCRRWQKKVSDLCIPSGDFRATNIVLEDSGHHIALVLNPDRSDPERKFLMVYNPHGRARSRGKRVMSTMAVSSDGLHWTTLSEDSPMRHQHFQRAIWDESIGRWISYSQYSPHWNFLHRKRQIGRQESEDFVNWSAKEVVLSADWDPQVSPDVEFHDMSVRKVGGLYIGIVTEFDAEPIWCAHDQDNWRDIAYATLSLYVSRDGVRWQRASGAEPWVDTGRAGSYDAGFVCDTVAGQLVHDGNCFIVYSARAEKQHWYGTERPKRKDGEARFVPLPAAAFAEGERDRVRLEEAMGTYPRNEESTIGTLILREDGWAELKPTYEKGRVITRQFVFEGEGLRINADCAGGYVRVEVVDPLFAPYPGFSASDCDPVAGEVGVWHPVSWRGDADVRALWNKPVRLIFHLHQASLFAFRFAASGDGR